MAKKLMKVSFNVPIEEDQVNQFMEKIEENVETFLNEEFDVNTYRDVEFGCREVIPEVYVIEGRANGKKIKTIIRDDRNDCTEILFTDDSMLTCAHTGVFLFIAAGDNAGKPID